MSAVLKFVPMENVQEALCVTEKNDKRERDLPNRQTVYFTIAMSLFASSSYEEVLRTLRDGLEDNYDLPNSQKIAAKSAISTARQRVGSEPLVELFRAVVKPIALRRQTKGAFAFGRRLVAVDGILFDVHDTRENAREFPRCSTATGPCAYPQVRCVALVECGTHVLFDYELTQGERKSEKALATELLHRLEPGQLCIADRLYSDYKRWKIAADTGADLLWRVKSDVRLDRGETFSDGSYMSELYGGDRNDGLCCPVRVIEYTVKHKTSREKYRLLTTLKPSEATAKQLAALYKERWEWESFGREFKKELNRVQDVLRSKLPDLVRQEIVASFLAYYAIRCFMHEAALSVDVDMDRLSFKHSLSVLRRNIARAKAFSPDAFQATVVRQMAEVRNPPRRNRSCPRAVKTQKRKYPVLAKRLRPRGRFGKRRTSTNSRTVKMRGYA
jgi:IS4 transposase